METLFDTNPELEEKWDWNVNNKLNIIPNNITNKSCKKVGWTCEKGHKWKAIINTRAKGTGCPYCSNHKVLVGYNDIPTTAPWMVKYFQGGYNEAKKYTKGSGKKVIFVCPECGKLKDKLMSVGLLYNSKTIRCGCNDGKSQGEKMILGLLQQLQTNNNFTEFNQEVGFKWCSFYSPYKQKQVTGRYDFAIEEYKLIIEVDGGFHRKDNNMNGQTVEESQFIDSEKDRLANENGYEIIRVSDEGNMKENILRSELNNIFDLSIIDWKECYKFSSSNLLRKVCLYWEDGFTIKEINKLTNIKIRTIEQYIRQGSRMGICALDNKNRANREENLTKSVICLNTNKIFNSIFEAYKWCDIEDIQLIKQNCENKINSAGRHPETNVPLVWRFTEEFNSFNDIEKNKLINNALKFSSNEYTNGKNVICLNTQGIFISISEANKWCKTKSLNTVSNNCNHITKSGGRHPQTNEVLVWMFLDEFDKLTKEQQELEIEKAKVYADKRDNIIYCGGEKKKVICLNTKEVFESASDGARWCKATNGASIVSCCKEKVNTGNCHPETGERLGWKYHEEFIKMSLEEQEELFEYFKNNKTFNMKRTPMICLNTNETFNNIDEASEKYDFKVTRSINHDCYKKPKFCGRDKETNKEYYWMILSGFNALSSIEQQQLLDKYRVK